ncbi:hypothetical protein MSC49_03300 [Methylosinus sp. C49]|uniref:hypothetical protein n=1 Tax=Methylosinus sp. C49 TaxID=2699395 RepID=UPI001366F6E9|nr:hypothetical protein [Methylosinus sp. C49]BBU60395.1 hypothetical protein MSC49_03300 [Methylosinus sp. C49]
MDAIAERDRDPCITVQKSDPFVRAGLVLFGARWKAPMARSLGVTRETVSRWVSADDVPPWATKIARLMIADRGAVLSLCDRTGNMARPWADAGFECFCVDLQHPDGGHARDGLTWIGADVRAWLPPPRRYAIVFAAPPCTHLAVSGARWFKEKGMGGLTEAIEIVEACRRICEWSGAPWMIENPVSTLGSYWRRPDFSFHPNEFGGYDGGEADDYPKRTCIWTGGGFRFPQKRPIPVGRPKFINHMPETPDRGNLRSVTPPGFARAVFEANVGKLHLCRR